jgi:HTH-type transcriptional regulator/antitoxin HigA
MSEIQHTQRPFTPDWISPPGATIADFLEELDWTQEELAERLEFSTKHVSQLINGKASITSDTAIKLSQVLGSSIQFWLNREANYQANLARLKYEQKLQEWMPWLDELPIKELQKMGELSSCRITQESKPRLVKEALEFFGCASPEAWKKCYQSHHLSVNFRQSLSNQSQKKLGAVSTWLRLGEIASQDEMLHSFDRKKFEAAIRECRNLTQASEAKIQTLVKQYCREAGVIFVFIPALAGARVSGVARWLNTHRPLIQVSLYGKTNDKFWFTFFHEAAHILLHGKDKIFVDDCHDNSELESKSEEEQEADQWAKNILIPERYVDRLKTLKSRVSVNSFADEIGLHPGIIVGRLQHERILPMNQLNNLKVSYTFQSDFP